MKNVYAILFIFWFCVFIVFKSRGELGRLGTRNGGARISFVHLHIHRRSW